MKQYTKKPMGNAKGDPDLTHLKKEYGICIRYVHPQSDWKNRCKALIESADATLLRGMGFPANWQTLALWK